MKEEGRWLVVLWLGWKHITKHSVIWMISLNHSMKEAAKGKQTSPFLLLFNKLISFLMKVIAAEFELSFNSMELKEKNEILPWNEEMAQLTFLCCGLSAALLSAKNNQINSIVIEFLCFSSWFCFIFQRETSAPSFFN